MKKSFPIYLHVIVVFLAAIMVPGSVNAEGLRGFLDKVKAGLDDSSARPNAVRLGDTPLAGILSESTFTGTPEWPKIAISNLEFPRSQLSPARSLSLKPNECIYFDATIWRDAASSSEIKGVALCARDLPNQSNSFVLVWMTFPIDGETTGTARTLGPVPPYSKLPKSTDLDNWVLNQYGQYYLGSLLSLVGFDHNYAPDTRRFWIVNLKGERGPDPSPTTAVAGNSLAPVGLAGAVVESNAGMSSSCSASAFTGENFDRIAPGMTLDEISGILGCTSNSAFTQRAEGYVVHVWTADFGGRPVALRIMVFFDKRGVALASPGKRATGF